METQLIQAIGFTAPIVCAVVCIFLLIIHLDAGQVKEQPKRILHYLLIGTYFVASLGWFGLVLYVTDLKTFEYYRPVFLLTLMLDQVMLYRFVSIITTTERKPRFNPLHYLLPALLTLVWFTVPALLPAEYPIPKPYRPPFDTIWQHKDYVGMSLVFIVYNSLYPVLCLLRIRTYRRKVVDYSADSQRTSLHWLSVMIVLILITVPLPLAALLVHINILSLHYLAWVGPFPTIIVYLILCYNLLSDNYVIIEPVKQEEETETTGKALNKKCFERYICEKRPYLNPKLRITDMAADLHTNRSYLSAFINREYQMNFSRYINLCRLQELDSLRTSHHGSTYTNLEMILLAGFSDYRSYTRTKAEEDKNRLLKVF